MDARRAVKRVLRRLGLDTHRVDRSSSVFLVALMKTHGVGAVIDVGANEGQFAEDLRTDGFSGPILSFEPGSAAFEILAANSAKDHFWDVQKLALSDEETTAELHLLGDATDVASLHSPVQAQADHFRFLGGEVRTETVTCKRLDSLDVPSKVRLLLKVDTQGHDVAVLRGATGILDQVTIIQTELSFDALYEGQTPWREVVDYLHGLGFIPAGFFPVVRDGDWSLVESDGVFVRKGVLR
jgi:FkbM family methyltransferase